MWVLFETNGYGLTPKNLDLFRKSGIDAFWLDIKAWDNEKEYKLKDVPSPNLGQMLKAYEAVKEAGLKNVR